MSGKKILDFSIVQSMLDLWVIVEHNTDGGAHVFLSCLLEFEGKLRDIGIDRKSKTGCSFDMESLNTLQFSWYIEGDLLQASLSILYKFF